MRIQTILLLSSLAFSASQLHARDTILHYDHGWENKRLLLEIKKDGQVYASKRECCPLRLRSKQAQLSAQELALLSELLGSSGFGPYTHYPLNLQALNQTSRKLVEKLEGRHSNQTILFWHKEYEQPWIVINEASAAYRLRSKVYQLVEKMGKALSDP